MPSYLFSYRFAAGPRTRACRSRCARDPSRRPTSCPKILGILPDPYVMARMGHPRYAGATVPFCQSSTHGYKPKGAFSHVKPPTEWRTRRSNPQIQP
ncbi:hypothetical protein HMPREF1136_0456 [Actinomyces sp. ICM47]|nr:hypothetical protein HMPREF1136_0456 [Actinomyces sp. ICM47]